MRQNSEIFVSHFLNSYSCLTEETADLLARLSDVETKKGYGLKFTSVSQGEMESVSNYWFNTLFYHMTNSYRPGFEKFDWLIASL